jgi:hypothetical protein
MKTYNREIAYTAVIRMADFCNERDQILEFHTRNSGFPDQQNNSAVFMLCPGESHVKEFCMSQFRRR